MVNTPKCTLRLNRNTLSTMWNPKNLTGQEIYLHLFTLICRVVQLVFGHVCDLQKI